MTFLSKTICINFSTLYLKKKYWKSSSPIIRQKRFFQNSCSDYFLREDIEQKNYSIFLFFVAKRLSIRAFLIDTEANRLIHS